MAGRSALPSPDQCVAAQTGAASGAEHDGMKSLSTSIPARFTKALSTGWSLLTGTPAPVKPLTPNAEQAVAHQDWEDEGGTCKPAEKPAAEPAPKIPL